MHRSSVPFSQDPRLPKRGEEEATRYLEEEYEVAPDRTIDPHNASRFIRDVSTSLLGISDLNDTEALEEKVIELAIALLEKRKMRKMRPSKPKGQGIEEYVDDDRLGYTEYDDTPPLRGRQAFATNPTLSQSIPQPRGGRKVPTSERFEMPLPPQKAVVPQPKREPRMEETNPIAFLASQIAPSSYTKRQPIKKTSEKHEDSIEDRLANLKKVLNAV